MLAKSSSTKPGFVDQLSPRPAPIALACFPASADLPEWPWEKRLLPDNLFHAAATLGALAAQTEAPYILLWDCQLGAPPNPETCQELLQEAGEVWHAGLSMGCAGQPAVLDYVHPTALLQVDAPANIASDSWRLSLRACLLKTEIVRAVGVFSSGFSTFDAAGLDWGYRLYRAGALMRHHPALAPATQASPAILFNLQDSLLFAVSHFTRRWYYWVIGRLWANGVSWIGLLKAIGNSFYKKHVFVNTLIRPLEPENPSFDAKKWQCQISILMPTLARYPYAINTLEQLLRQTVQPKEILITDQTDAPNRWEGFADNYPNTKVFVQTEKGQCVAWNKLLEAATGEYVLFLGDDADGIPPDFLENMCRSLDHYRAEMAASNVLEIGGAPDPYTDRVVKMADGFPIVLIKKDLVVRAGMMQMAFNKGIRADQDLAIRCHQLGAHMIFDSDCRILHHRAPTGGLRWHRQRVLTRHISKQSPFKIQYPTATELVLYRSYFSKKQCKEHAYMLMVSQLFIRGAWWNRLLRIGYFLLCLPLVIQRYAKLYR